MSTSPNMVNLVLSGGGIRGIAYAGVFESAKNYKIKIGNISGVSSGSIAGAYLAAGYDHKAILGLLNNFNFGNLKIEELHNYVPAVQRLYEYSQTTKAKPDDVIDRFLQVPAVVGYRDDEPIDFDNRGIFQNIILYSKLGCLYDGDALEEWVYGNLKRAGVKTFADVRSNITDTVNPKGYKVRMTAVDADRKRILVLPDDLAFYGYDPDKFEVARAIRMSCSVPFAFKPVEIQSEVNGYKRVFHIVDGGVLDNFPVWLHDRTSKIPTVGFRLLGSHQKKLLSLDTPLSIYKSLVMKSHDIGLPKQKYFVDYVGDIYCQNVGFLDMNLDDEQKKYLYSRGKNSADLIFPMVKKRFGKSKKYNICPKCGRRKFYR